MKRAAYLMIIIILVFNTFTFSTVPLSKGNEFFNIYPLNILSIKNFSFYYGANVNFPYLFTFFSYNISLIFSTNFKNN